MAKKRNDNARYWTMVHEAERNIIRFAFEQGGTLTRTAEILGVSVNFLSKKIKSLEMQIKLRRGPQKKIPNGNDEEVVVVADQSANDARPLPEFLAAASTPMPEDETTPEWSNDDEDGNASKGGEHTEDDSVQEAVEDEDNDDEFEDDDEFEEDEEDEEDDEANNNSQRSAPALTVVRSNDDDLQEN